MKQILAAILLTSGLLQAQCPKCDCPGKWTETYNQVDGPRSGNISFTPTPYGYAKFEDYEVLATHEVCGEIRVYVAKQIRYEAYIRDKKVSTWTTEEAAKKAVETACLIPKFPTPTSFYVDGGYASPVAVGGAKP